MSRLIYSSILDDPQDEEDSDEFLDVTDDYEPDYEPEDYYVDDPEADYIYDPLSRRGFE